MNWTGLDRLKGHVSCFMIVDWTPREPLLHTSLEESWLRGWHGPFFEYQTGGTIHFNDDFQGV